MPVLPGVLNRLCIGFRGIRIGDPVTIREGLYLPHGTIVIDGITLIGEYCTNAPHVTIGLKQRHYIGPTSAGDVIIGTVAKIIGSVRVGRTANIGAAAVVVHDVAPGASVAGAPALPLG